MSSTLLALLLWSGLGGAYAFAQLTTSERSALDKVNPARAIADLRRLSEGVVKTRSGAGDGTADAGTPEEKALADAIAQDLKKIGLAVRTEPFPLRRYTFGEVKLSAAGKPIRAISLHAAGGTWGTRDGVPYTKGNEDNGHRIRTTLVDVGAGYAPDYDRAGNVKGKAVLVQRGQAWPVYQILEAAHRGAAAILIYDYPQSPDDTIKQDSMWYHEQVPMVSLSKADAKSLQESLKPGPVEITLENRIDSGDGVSQNVIGTIRGSEFPDEWVIVSAHYDRWWVAAQDNCSGVAAMLEIARAITASGKPRRSLMFLATGGEEAGVEHSEQDWLAGSHAFVQAHPEIERRLVYNFNLDTVGWTADKGTLASTAEMVPYMERLLADMGLADRIAARPTLGNTTDAWNFGIVGGGGSSILQWTSVFGEARTTNQPNPFSKYYHTQMDVYRPEDYKNFDTHLRVGVLGVLRMDRALPVPIRFTSVADWASAALTSDATRAPEVSFEDARARLAEFRAQAERVEKAQAGITSTDQAEMLNRWLMRIRKDLMPWLYGQNANLRSTGYANLFAALTQAAVAAEKGDRPEVMAALERVNTVRQAAQVSPEVARAERLYWYSSGDWSSAYYQKQKLVGEELNALYRRLRNGGDLKAELPELRRHVAEAQGYLLEALLIIGGKFREAAAELSESPVP